MKKNKGGRRRILVLKRGHCLRSSLILCTSRATIAIPGDGSGVGLGVGCGDGTGVGAGDGAGVGWGVGRGVGAI